MNKLLFIQKLNQLEHFLRTHHMSPRAVLEFVILLLALVFAEPTEMSMWLGLAVSAGGEALKIWASGIKDHEKSYLRMNGPYKFTSHPQAVGSFLLFLGICFASRSFMTISLYILTNVLLFKLEYFRLKSKGPFNSDPQVALYESQVSWFFPQLVPVKVTDQGNQKFSFKYSIFERKSRELDRLIGLAFVYLIFYLMIKFPMPRFWDVLTMIVLFSFVCIRTLYYSSVGGKFKHIFAKGS